MPIMSKSYKAAQISPTKTLYHQLCECQFLLLVRDRETSKSDGLKITGFDL